jgi:membrane dipeptidase
VTGRAAWRAERPWLDPVPVCDGLLPWTAAFLPGGASLVATLARFRDAGVDHVSLTAAAGRDGPATALARLGFLRRALAGTDVVVADGSDGVRAAAASGRFSVAFHFQSATPFTSDLDLVDAFRSAGVARAILAYNEANAFADGCHEARDAGLTALGHALLRRMDAANMVVDLSHCGARSSFDAMDAPLARPPVFSHSNARALFDHERNITDDQIRAVGARGGYVGVSGVGMFLGVAGPRIPRAMARHAAHVAALVGAGRVGLGLDFMFLEGSDYGFYHAARGRWPRGYPPPPWDFLQPEQLGELVSELEAAGFGRDELPGVLGLNYLRHAA